MLNKKVFLSVLIIGVVGALAGSATWAYFQDTEISENNTLTAGTLDLYLDPFTTPFTVNNVDPGDSGIKTHTIKNVGNLDGELDIAVGTITNGEGTPLDSDFPDPNTERGELGGATKMLVFIDIDNSGILSNGDIVLDPATGSFTSATGITDQVSIDTYFLAESSSINSYGSKKFDAVIPLMRGGVAGTGDEYDVCFMWEVPGNTGNSIQGDSVRFDITYKLEQPEVDNA